MPLRVQPLSLHTSILPGLPTDPAFSRGWNDLVASTGAPDVFQTYEWHASLERSGLAGHTHLMLFSEGSTLKGIAYFQRSAPGARTLHLLGRDASDYDDVLSRPHDREAVLAALLDQTRRERADALVLSNVPSASPTCALLPRLARSLGWYVTLRSVSVCPRIAWSGPEAGAAIGRAAVGRQSVRRHTHALEKMGSLRLYHHTGDAEILRRLPEFFRAHVARFLATGRRSPLLEDARRKLLEIAASHYAPQLGLVLSELRLGSVSIAWSLGFRYNGTWLWYIPTFDPRYKRFWPGEVLLARLVSDAISDPTLHCIDLGLGDEFYKSRFANETGHTLEFRLDRNRFRTLGSQIAVRLLGLTPSGDAGQTRRAAAARATMRLLRLVRARGLLTLLWGSLRRTLRYVAMREVVVFASADARAADPMPHAPGSPRLVALNWGTLAETALQWRCQEESLDYLARAAERLLSQRQLGYVLLADCDVAVHCLWTVQMRGFHVAEVDAVLGSAWRGKTLIIDCWTPANQRGRHWYGQALRLAVQSAGSDPSRVWIFASARNTASLKGILRSGFRPRLKTTFTRVLGCRCWHHLRVRRVQLPGEHDTEL